MKTKTHPVFIMAAIIAIIAMSLWTIKLAKEVINDEPNTCCCQQNSTFGGFGEIWDDVDKMSVSAIATQKIGKDTMVNGIQLTKVIVRLPWGVDTAYAYSAYFDSSTLVSGKAVNMLGRHSFFYREKNDLWGISIAFLTKGGLKHNK